MLRAHIEGPPGTGKTSHLMGVTRPDGTRKPGQIERAAAVYGPDKVLAASLTKAAAKELAGRNSSIPKRQIGTGHSICYHALEARIITRGEVREFCDAHPEWALDPGEIGVAAKGEEDPDRSEMPTNGLYARYDLLRHRMVPEETWPSEIRRFHRDFTAYKRELGARDFTDLIADCLAEVDDAPGSPEAFFLDEAQDFSRLELELWLKWARHAETLVLVGDRLQALYSWRGADPGILDPAEANHATVLAQSYRVPAAVHARACAAVRGLPGSEAAYRPTLLEGEVAEAPWSWKRPEAILDDLAPAIESGESAMVIAPCGYQVQPLVTALRREGIPYHNPYSPRRWNPLRPIGAARRLLAFLRPHVAGDGAWLIPPYTAAEVRQWAPMLKAACFVGGGKTRDRLTKSEDPFNVNDLATEAQGAVIDGDWRWVMMNSVASMRGSDYLARVLDRLGREEFHRQMLQDPRKKPWITVGTIHSVKGGEADHVAIIPDLSPQGIRQQYVDGWHGREALQRLAYVALTRSRNRVLIGRRLGRGLDL